MGLEISFYLALLWYNWQIKLYYLKHTVKWFNIVKNISIPITINISITLHICLFCGKVHLSSVLSKFQLYNIVLTTIATMLCFAHFITEIFVFFYQPFHIPQLSSLQKSLPYILLPEMQRFIPHVKIFHM